MVYLIIDIVLCVMCWLHLVFPISFGLSGKNIYIGILRAVSTNFNLVWGVFLIVMILLQVWERKAQTDHIGTRVNVLIIVTVIITLVLSIL